MSGAASRADMAGSVEAAAWEEAEAAWEEAQMAWVYLEENNDGCGSPGNNPARCGSAAGLPQCGWRQAGCV